MELSRLLRRVLLVAAVAAAGWLLSAAFAGTAGADELPDDGTQNQRLQSGNGLLGGLVGGLSGVLTGATDTVSDITGSLLRPPEDLLPPVTEEPPAPQKPAAEPPATLPAGSSSGEAATDRPDSDADMALTDPAVPVPAPAPPAAPVVTSPAPVVAAPVRVAAPVAPPVIAVPTAPVVAKDTGSSAAEHADEGDSQPRPVKAPAAPAGSGTAVSSTHDNPGGARGTHGVLPTQATLHPADAGFTTRGLAHGAAGRAPGLPASSPD